MEDFATQSWGLATLSELESKREWFVGVLGATVCYGLILWLL